MSSPHALGLLPFFAKGSCMHVAGGQTQNDMGKPGVAVDGGNHPLLKIIRMLDICRWYMHLQKLSDCTRTLPEISLCIPLGAVPA